MYSKIISSDGKVEWGRVASGSSLVHEEEALRWKTSSHSFKHGKSSKNILTSGKVGWGRAARNSSVGLEEEAAWCKHPDSLLIMGDLASTYFHQGKLNEAEQLEVQVLDCYCTISHLTSFWSLLLLLMRCTHHCLLLFTHTHTQSRVRIQHSSVAYFGL